MKKIKQLFYGLAKKKRLSFFKKKEKGPIVPGSIKASKYVPSFLSSLEGARARNTRGI